MLTNHTLNRVFCTLLIGHTDQSRRTSDPYFTHDVLAMHTHRLVADKELFSDLLIAHSLTDQAQDLCFAFSKLMLLDE